MNDDITRARESLLAEKETKSPQQLLKSPVFGALFELLKTMPADKKALFGKELNALREEVLSWQQAEVEEAVEPIDITAPWDVNTNVDQRPRHLDSHLGSKHVLTSELEKISEIFPTDGLCS
jgi:hypothetical protein